MGRAAPRRAILIGLLVLTGLALWGSPRARTQSGPTAEPVDLHLVLAVDVSWSMDPEEQQLQRDGYVQAFRDPDVIRAIRSGQTGRIAVTYFEWAGADIQFMVVPWRIIDGKEAADRLATDLSSRRISRHRMTSISSALGYAQRLLRDAPGEALRRVVDVSGDGPNNSGISPVTLVRDELLRDGVVINGLPIMLKTAMDGMAGYGQDIPDLDAYYANCVTGGAGSFVIPIRERAEFATATRQKILQEVSQFGPPRLMRAQFAPGIGAQDGAANGSYDCEVGEKNWRRYYLDRGR